MKNLKLWIAVAAMTGLAACAKTNSEKVSGSYSGMYTSTSGVAAGTLQITSNGDNGVNIAFSPPSITAVTVNNVALTANADTIALTYVTFNEQVSGTFVPNAITVAYTAPSTSTYFSFTGTK